MKKKMLWIIVAVILITIIVAVGVRYSTPEIPKTIENVFLCSSVEELEKYVLVNNVQCEKRDNTLHLYNVEIFGQVGYCVAEFQFNTNALKQITFYISYENSNEVFQTAEVVKKNFLTELGFEADYEYFPLNSDVDVATKQDFTEQNASMELFAYDEESIWNISWLIVEDGVSARITKTVKK